LNRYRYSCLASPSWFPPVYAKCFKLICKLQTIIECWHCWLLRKWSNIPLSSTFNSFHILIWPPLNLNVLLSTSIPNKYSINPMKISNPRDRHLIILFNVIDCTSRSRIFHLYGDVTVAGEGLQNLGLCSALRAFEQVGSPAVTRDLGFSGLIRRTAPFSRLLRHTRGCGGCILTRILTGLSSLKIIR
jgi:hypothetical protein